MHEMKCPCMSEEQNCTMKVVYYTVQYTLNNIDSIQSIHYTHTAMCAKVALERWNLPQLEPAELQDSEKLSQQALRDRNIFSTSIVSAAVIMFTAFNYQRFAMFEH